MFRRWLSLCLMLAVAGILRAQEMPGDTALSMVSPDSLEVVEKADSIGKKSESDLSGSLFRHSVIRTPLI